MPEITVGMPVYNGEQFVEESIKSVLAQTFDDFELLISDNCSTDRTAEICREYAARDRRIRYWCNDRNLGAAGNYNILYEQAAAPFFRFIMELTTWIWLIFTNLYLLAFSILSLAFLNFPGDKKPAKEGVIGLAIPGKLRVILEILTALLGFPAAYFFLGTIGFLLQVLIVLLYIKLDLPRLKWMWGIEKTPPEYVTQLHKERERRKNEN